MTLISILVNWTYKENGWRVILHLQIRIVLREQGSGVQIKSPEKRVVSKGPYKSRPDSLQRI